MIRYKKDTDNIVTLILDMKDRAINVINHEIGDAFLPVLAQLKREKARGVLRGVILTSAKKSFLAGGDWEYLYQADDAAEIFSFSEKLKQFLRDLESPGVPVVAAINGTALGTGFEVALACHHRIVVEDPKIQLGNPEVNIGLIPGAGGIVRMMWLLGIEKTFAILSAGRPYSPQDALRAGVIDELAKDKKDMLERAKAWLMKTKEGRRPWDIAGGSIPGGTAKDMDVAELIATLATTLAGTTYRHYTARQAILNILSEGSKVDFNTACRIESRYYTQLLCSRACKNMIRAFWFDVNAIKAGADRPKGYGKFRPKKVGIIGAGQMGSGIAVACLLNGLEVVLKDVSRAIAARGLEYVRMQLQKLEATHQIRPAETTALLRRIQTTEQSKDFETCDLVIEAVFENQMVKQKVTKEAEAFMDEYSFFGTNTVSIPITKLAEASIRAENFAGLHFFHPAEEVPLVEIVRGKRTSDETIARAFDFVNAIRKIPIVVKDDWGFYVARVQNTYILEGITMLKEGYPPALIENIGKQAGMPKGALRLADDLGLTLVLNYEQQAAAHYGTKYIQHPAVSVLQLMTDALSRNGRSQKAGFYEYEEEGGQRLWPELAEHFQPVRTDWVREEIAERLLFVQVLEAVWCMQEGVINSVPAANLGSIHGWGFPEFKGGVIQYINDYGKAAFLAKCQYYEAAHGPRFKAPVWLKKTL